MKKSKAKKKGGPPMEPSPPPPPPPPPPSATVLPPVEAMENSNIETPKVKKVAFKNVEIPVSMASFSHYARLKMF